MAPHSAFPEDVAVDVLLVGAGPAGYMAAVTLARYGVNFHIIDQRAETIQGGQAGGTYRESGGFLKLWSSRENDTRREWLPLFHDSSCSGALTRPDEFVLVSHLEEQRFGCLRCGSRVTDIMLKRVGRGSFPPLQFWRAEANSGKSRHTSSYTRSLADS